MLYRVLEPKATKKMTDDSCCYAKGARAVRYNPGRLYHQQPNFTRFQKENSHLQEVFKKASPDGGKCVQKLLTHLELRPKCRLFK